MVASERFAEAKARLRTVTTGNEEQERVLADHHAVAKQVCSAGCLAAVH